MDGLNSSKPRAKARQMCLVTKLILLILVWFVFTILNRGVVRYADLPVYSQPRKLESRFRFLVALSSQVAKISLADVEISCFPTIHVIKTCTAFSHCAPRCE